MCGSGIFLPVVVPSFIAPVISVLASNLDGGAKLYSSRSAVNVQSEQ